MRCLDSNVYVPVVYRRSDCRGKCGNCGKIVKTIVDVEGTTRYAVHGSRDRCQVCGSHDPKHHVSDHERDAAAAVRRGWS